MKRGTVLYIHPIATHAPAQGTTRPAKNMLICQRFQLPHPRGVQPRLCAFQVYIAQDFNSRTRVGCDDSQAQWKQSGKAISTPAPTRGATWRASVGCSSFHILTPVPHAGRDKRLQANYQFTSCFNSHTQEGGDTAGRRFALANPVSTHAPHEGCDGGIIDICHYYFLFQLTHPRGVRRWLRG